MRSKGRFARVLSAAVAMLCFSASAAMADFTKTITVTPGVEVNAVTTWYYQNCDTSLGLGTYAINVAPDHGTLRFADVSGPLPGCPSGSPDLPAVAAFYTWTGDTLGAQSDYFQLYYELDGNVEEVIDVTVDLATTGSPSCRISTRTTHSAPGVLDSRRKIGVGETVVLTSNIGPLNWNISSGGGALAPLRANGTCPVSGLATAQQNGTSVCFIAPYAAGATEVSGTPEGGSSCAVTFSTVQPSGLIFARLKSPPLPSPGYGFGVSGPDYNVSMESAVFVTPGDVSFANVRITEHGVDNAFTSRSYDPMALLPVAGTYASLIGCDYSQSQGSTASTTLTEPSYFTYSDLSGGHETEFAQVDTTLWHQVGFYSVVYTKQQTAALSPAGKWMNTPYAAGSVLDFPWDSAPSTLNPIGPYMCLRDANLQFTRAAAAAAKTKSGRRPAVQVASH